MSETPNIPYFTIKLYEKHEKEVTTWTDDTHCFEPGETHIALGRSTDCREHHLWGEDAKQFLKLLGAPEAWR